MSIYVACECGQAFHARDDLAGQRLACPACGRGLQVPIAANLGPLAANSGQRLVGPSTYGRPASNRLTIWLSLLLGSAILATGGLVVALISLSAWGYRTGSPIAVDPVADVSMPEAPSAPSQPASVNEPAKTEATSEGIDFFSGNAGGEPALLPSYGTIVSPPGVPVEVWLPSPVSLKEGPGYSKLATSHKREWTAYQGPAGTHVAYACYTFSGITTEAGLLAEFEAMHAFPELKQIGRHELPQDGDYKNESMRSLTLDGHPGCEFLISMKGGAFGNEMTRAFAIGNTVHTLRFSTGSPLARDLQLSVDSLRIKYPGKPGLELGSLYRESWNHAVKQPTTDVTPAIPLPNRGAVWISTNGQCECWLPCQRDWVVDRELNAQLFTTRNVTKKERGIAVYTGELIPRTFPVKDSFRAGDDIWISEYHLQDIDPAAVWAERVSAISNTQGLPAERMPQIRQFDVGGFPAIERIDNIGQPGRGKAYFQRYVLVNDVLYYLEWRMLAAADDQGDLERMAQSFRIRTPGFSALALGSQEP